jgi:hypothetical protein
VREKTDRERERDARESERLKERKREKNRELYWNNLDFKLEKDLERGIILTLN